MRLFLGYGRLRGISFEEYVSDDYWEYADSDADDGTIIAYNTYTDEYVYVIDD